MWELNVSAVSDSASGCVPLRSISAGRPVCYSADLRSLHGFDRPVRAIAPGGVPTDDGRGRRRGDRALRRPDVTSASPKRRDTFTPSRQPNALAGGRGAGALGEHAHPWRLTADPPICPLQYPRSGPAGCSCQVGVRFRFAVPPSWATSPGQKQSGGACDRRANKERGESGLSAFGRCTRPSRKDRAALRALPLLTQVSDLGVKNH
jgi:hypothetical protein